MVLQQNDCMYSNDEDARGYDSFGVFVVTIIFDIISNKFKLKVRNILSLYVTVK